MKNKNKVIPMERPTPPAFIFGVDAEGKLCAEQLPAGWTTMRISNGLQVVDCRIGARECFTVLYSHTQHGGAGVLVLWTGTEGDQQVLYDDLTENAAETFVGVTQTINKWFRKRGHK